MQIDTIYQDIHLKDGDVVVFGCSFGPDSMALFKSLVLLRNKIDIKLVCAHVHHGKRKESDQEKEDLEAYCQQYNVIFEYMKIEHYSDDNFHNEARHIRYQFFKDVADKYHATYIMTAHHADDLMETILMRMTRGSTLEGYSGFKKVSQLGEYTLYRPFISYTKDQLLSFDKQHHVPYALDASNDSNVYTRNRYRKVILPFLKQEDPNVHQKFIKYSQTLQEADAYIKQQTITAVSNVIDDNLLDIPLFLQQDHYLQKRILEYLLHQFYQDDLILLGEKHVEILQKLARSRRANAMIFLPNDILAIKKYNKLYLQKNIDVISNYDMEINDLVWLPNHHVLKVVAQSSGNSNAMTRLSSKEVKLPLRVRTREEGDVMAIKGGGHKKIKDIFIDKKIPLKERDTWPIVVDATNQIVFLPGLKKSKFDRKKDEIYDIILEYE